MKIKLHAENMMEWLGQKLNLVPKPLIETQIFFTSARAIMAAADLGIFEAMGNEAKEAGEIAQACKTHPAGTQHLLDCLVGIGYLQCNGSRYSLKKSLRKWLLKESDSNLIEKLRFQLLEWNWLAKLEDYVRTGTPLDIHKSVSRDEWELYQEGMRDLSINAARELAVKLPLPPRRYADARYRRFAWPLLH